MKTRLLGTLLLCWLAQWSMAQAPKWVEKAKRSVFSIVTYDDSDKILKTGNGFFVSEDGVALSDYTLFKGAKRAVAITGEGKQMPVEAIMGVDDMYDVAKFRVAIDGKKVQALPLAATAPAVGSKVLLLPYSTQKDRSFTPGELKAADKAGEKYYYYTLGMHLRDKMVSCPVLTEQGQVFGLAQLSSGKDTATVFVGDAAVVSVVEAGVVPDTYPQKENVLTDGTPSAHGKLEAKDYDTDADGTPHKVEFSINKTESGQEPELSDFGALAPEIQDAISQQFPEERPISPTVHQAENFIIAMLDGNIQIFDDFILRGNHVNQFVVNFIRINIVYPNPMKAIDLTQLS